MSSLNRLIPYVPLIIYLLFLAVSIAWLWRVLRPRDQHSLRTVAILVLGDIGRSPRMMYHAQSFAENGFVTDIIGYGGSKPIPSLERLPRVRLWFLPELPKFLFRLPFIISAPIKVVHQITHILLCLFVWIDVPPEFIVVQNPPSIPTLAIVQLVSRIRGSKVIIDWHNLGYSILSLKLGNDHLLVRIAKRFEQTFGQTAYAHLFVTKAMRDSLVKQWDLQGNKVVLHDRPPRHFHRSSIQETHDLFLKLQPNFVAQKSLQKFLPETSIPYSTPLTQTNQPKLATPTETLPYQAELASAPVIYSEVQMPTKRPDRPAVLVSSTSWTADEDFGILLDALAIYEARAEEMTSRKGLPKLLVIVTGKGPLRAHYLAKINKQQANWKWVRCISLWLEAEDYPVLLGSADLGVSLHSSSSGLDLPMKVVDMFGCGLPVCALGFSCLDELVQHGKNGLVFKDGQQLAEQLEEVFTGFPKAPRLRVLTEWVNSVAQRPATPTNPHVSKQGSRSVEEFRWSSWEDNWGRVMRPLILRDVNL